MNWYTYLVNWLNTHPWLKSQVILPSMPETTQVTPAVANKTDYFGLFCQSIAIYEGGETPGTIPYRTNNCGDLRWPYGAPYPYGATGVADGDFLTFATPADGMNALKAYVTRVAKGQSKLYPANCTIEQFFSVYAPSSDNNNPNAYATWVAERLGVNSAVYKISELLVS